MNSPAVSFEEAMLGGRYRIIDISQPVTSKTACFPGDVPFSKQMTLEHASCGIINLTAMTLSPHVGTHADAPSHIGGNMESVGDNAGSMPLEPYLGPCIVIDVAPFNGAISREMLESTVRNLASIPARVLFRTQATIDYDVFNQESAYFSVEMVEKAQEYGIELLGIDTSSVDDVNSKTLDAHHALQDGGIYWLENLDLTKVAAGAYFLVALPLKFMELEATPVRAVLLGAENVQS